MPHDEDWMPINGNPHPLPGVPFPELPPFILPPYPVMGWNDVPPPPPEHPDMGDNNWGNAVWGEDDEVAQYDVEVEPQSMVLDLYDDLSVSVEQHTQPNFVLVFDVEQQAEPEVGHEQPVVVELFTILTTGPWWFITLLHLLRIGLRILLWKRLH